MQDIAASIRDIADFPSPGIVFKDLTPVMRNARLLRTVAAELARPFHTEAVTVVLAMEARGFIFGSLVAAELDVGFVPLRKPGKLPWHTHRESYQLEYGSAALEIHQDALGPDDRVLLVDDLIATGGTAAAGLTLVARSGATAVGAAFVVELDALNGRRALGNCRVHSLVHY